MKNLHLLFGLMHCEGERRLVLKWRSPRAVLFFSLSVSRFSPLNFFFVSRLSGLGLERACNDDMTCDNYLLFFFFNYSMCIVPLIMTRPFLEFLLRFGMGLRWGWWCWRGVYSYSCCSRTPLRFIGHGNRYGYLPVICLAESQLQCFLPLSRHISFFDLKMPATFR